MYEHGGWMGFGGGLMWVFWILLIVVVVLLVKGIGSGGSGGSGGNAPREEDPLEILRRRYARGEIDEEEFRRRRDELRP